MSLAPLDKATLSQTLSHIKQIFRRTTNATVWLLSAAGLHHHRGAPYRGDIKGVEWV